MIRIARIVSLLFNPVLFLILLPYFIVYRETGSNFYALKWELFSLAFILVGLFLLFMGKRMKIFSDYDLSIREERAKFYKILWILGFSYLIAVLFFKGIFFALSVLAGGTIFGILVFSVANHFLKASGHMAVACAFILTITIFYKSSAFLATFWIIPILAWSRLVLKRHTFIEVVVGSILGCCITLITFFVAKEVL